MRTSEGVRSSLQLRAAERHDAGEYRCHARNQYGRSDLLMFLQVEGSYISNDAILPLLVNFINFSYLFNLCNNFSKFSKHKIGTY